MKMLSYKKSLILGITSQAIGLILALIVSKYFNAIFFNYFGLSGFNLLEYVVPGVVVSAGISLYYHFKYPSEELKKINSIIGFSCLTAILGSILFFAILLYSWGRSPM